MSSTPNAVAVVPASKASKKSKSKIDDADIYLKSKLVEVVNSEKSYHDILSYIKNEITESTRTISFNYKIKCFLEDGAYALSRAVEEIHGFTSQKDVAGPSGSTPPQMMDVRFADGTREKVPFGKVQLAAIGKEAFIDMKYDPKNQMLLLEGQCEKRFVRLMDEIVEETTRIVREDSIYRGKAIKFTKEGESPAFIDLSNIESTPLFLTPEAVFATQPIEARIEHTERCRRNGIDLRFGCLLEGHYGTGKTLYAFKLALKAVNNGWSFIYCPNPEITMYAMEIANMMSKNGKGSVLFIEDIDRILYERNELTNKISLLMDGGETKSNNVISILTTNHIEKINPTFLRGKRIGSIVTLTYPDKATAKKMIEKYLVDEFGKSILSEDCEDAASEVEKMKIVPSFIVEILERVKAHLIYSGNTTVNCQDVISCIRSYKKQMDIAAVIGNTETEEELFVKAFKNVIGTPVLDPKKVGDVVREVLTEKGF